MTNKKRQLFNTKDPINGIVVILRVILLHTSEPLRFLQMRKFKFEDIIRVCVDGIYFNGKTPELVSSFREQHQVIKMNVGGYEYIPFRQSREKLYIEEDVELTNFSSSKLYAGAGGTG